VPLLLTNDEIMPLLQMGDALTIVEDAYKEYGRGAIVNVPWSMVTVPLDKPHHEYHMIELRAAVPKWGISALRITSSASDYTGGAARRLPKPEGLRTDQILLFDIRSGQLLAILAGEHMQLLRVAATSALGVKYLAREDSATLGIIGSGGQAESQLEAIALVRPIQRALVYSRSADSREGFAARARTRYPFAVEAVESTDTLVEQSDIVTAAASAVVPTFNGSRVRPGTHVNTLTAAQVDDAVLARASLFCTTKGHLYVYPFQQPRHVFQGDQAYYQHWDRVQELESVMLGNAPGRQSADEITFFYGEGAGLQFAALGYLVWQRARDRGVGRELPTEWFLGS
jgi:alanine dehydrogenase